METGFGSPYINLGFGSPYHGSVRSTGFGSPYDLVVSTASLDSTMLPNNGGVRLHIYADWKTLTQSTTYPKIFDGFKVSFIDDQGIVQAISHGGYPQSRGKCSTDVRQTYLVCYVPPLEKGQYSILVQWGRDKSLRLDQSIQIVDRYRASSVYSIRQQIPPILKTGARTSMSDEIDQDRYDFGMLESLLLTVGEQIHALVGQPTTCLTHDFDDLYDQVLYVESTLGFPDQGKIYVDGIPMTYRSKTMKSFSDLSYTETAKTILKGGIISYVISDI